VFANILKYIRMGASSNFGNMFSVLGASIFLPFVPMAPLQILTNNLLYDVSQVPIPTDDVDPDQIAKPRPWSMNAIARFISDYPAAPPFSKRQRDRSDPELLARRGPRSGRDREGKDHERG
jgi:hypothetical protein